MKMWKRLAAALFLLTLVRLPASSTPQGETVTALSNKPEVMKGLEGVLVAVENIGNDAEQDGLSKDAIQTDVELKLRQSGIRVLAKEEDDKTLGMPFLYVNVHAFKSKNVPLYAFNVEVELHEAVFLKRNPKTTVVGATTWNKESTGMVGKDNIQSIRDAVKDVTDMFCNDYLTANPKQ